jgi:hypothetical protein
VERFQDDELVDAALAPGKLEVHHRRPAAPELGHDTILPYTLKRGGVPGQVANVLLLGHHAEIVYHLELRKIPVFRKS